MQLLKIAVAASFTAEPLMDSLLFWSEKLHWEADIQFAAYQQIFQQLLDPRSLLSTNDKGINVILVRPEDWLRYERSPWSVWTVVTPCEALLSVPQYLTSCVSAPHARIGQAILSFAR